MPAQTPSASQLEEGVLRLLATRYGGSTGARALWSWAGGADHEVIPHEDPAVVWSSLWELAAQGSDPIPERRAAIIREALHDQPNRARLLDYLVALVKEQHQEVQSSANVLLVCLERMRPFGFPATVLGPTLQAFPFHDWQEAFAAFAPALSGWLSFLEREELVTACQRVLDWERRVHGLHELRDYLRDHEEDDDAVREANIQRSLTQLQTTAEQVAALAQSEPLFAPLHKRLDRLQRRFSWHRPKLHSLVTGLTSLLSGLSLAALTEHGLASPVANGLLAAVWATRGAEPAAPRPIEATA